MAKVFSRNPEMLLKLAATTVGLTVAVAKLHTYRKSIMEEFAKDAEFIYNLKQAYLLSSVDEEIFAEKFSAVSDEADKLALELMDENGHRQ